MTSDEWVPQVGERVLFDCRIKRQVGDGLYYVSDPESKNRHAVATLGELRPADTEPSVDEMWVQLVEGRDVVISRCVHEVRVDVRQGYFSETERYYGDTLSDAIRKAWEATCDTTHISD